MWTAGRPGDGPRRRLFSRRSYGERVIIVLLVVIVRAEDLRGAKSLVRQVTAFGHSDPTSDAPQARETKSAGDSYALLMTGAVHRHGRIRWSVPPCGAWSARTCLRFVHGPFRTPRSLRVSLVQISGTSFYT